MKLYRTYEACEHRPQWNIRHRTLRNNRCVMLTMMTIEMIANMKINCSNLDRRIRESYEREFLTELNYSLDIFVSRYCNIDKQINVNNADTYFGEHRNCLGVVSFDRKSE